MGHDPLGNAVGLKSGYIPPKRMGTRKMTTDMFSHFSWGEFASIATLYTLIPFLSGARFGDSKPALQLIAKIRSAPTPIIGIHIGFLCSLFAILWESARIYSSLPIWMTAQNAKLLSVVDLVIGVVVILMVSVEQRWILKLKSSSFAAPGE